jgi:hypothetical protein
MLSSNPTRFLACAFLAAAFATVAQGQATRTWVSGVGDDVNPCSRTAPCKTFAGAISKTAEGGEIDPLDPAGYGTVTITKAMTLDGGTGSGWASILATGTANAINVNITTGTHINDAVVILRNLTINGTNQAPSAGGVLTNGVNVTKVFKLIIESCVFENLLGNGITQNNLASGSSTQVTACYFDNVTTSILGKTTSGFATTEVDSCHFNGGTDGILASQNAFINISNSTFSGLSGSVNGGARSNAGCQVNVSNSTFHGVALCVNSAGGNIRISNNDFFNNTTAIAGTAETANNNRFKGNGADGNVSAGSIVVK